MQTSGLKYVSAVVKRPTKQRRVEWHLTDTDRLPVPPATDLFLPSFLKFTSLPQAVAAEVPVESVVRLGVQIGCFK